MLLLEVSNFQSIEHAEVCVDGFTALVGRSNIGKSSVVRAAKSALNGVQGTAFVRHGPGCLRRTKGAKNCKCFSTVKITGDGIDILWEKGDAVSRYVVNGEIFEAIPKGFPDFLKPGFTPVQVGDRSVSLQVADQFDPIFLLGETGTTVADVLGDVARLDSINTATRLAEKDRREVRWLRQGLGERFSGVRGLGIPRRPRC
jgi:hypothetical protein